MQVQCTLMRCWRVAKILLKSETYTRRLLDIRFTCNYPDPYWEHKVWLQHRQFRPSMFLISIQLFSLFNFNFMINLCPLGTSKLSCKWLPLRYAVPRYLWGMVKSIPFEISDFLDDCPLVCWCLCTCGSYTFCEFCRTVFVQLFDKHALLKTWYFLEVCFNADFPRNVDFDIKSVWSLH